MITSAALADLIDALEEQSDTLFAYLDRETGEILLFPEESLSLAEREPEDMERLAGWQQDEAKLAVQIATTERYLALPDRFAVNEWKIMRDFCDQLKLEQARVTLQNVIHGHHAFRRFKEQLTNLGLWNSWNQFRRSAFQEILLAWCEENAITLTDAGRTGSRGSGQGV